MEQEAKRHEFDTNQAYRFVTVTDRQGNDKVQDFYKARLNCVAVDF